MLNTVRPVNKSLCLQMLCEENYTKLLRLIPKIAQGDFNSFAVHSNVLATGPFTYTVYLHYTHTSKSAPKPRFKCRIYLDTKSVEVIHIDEHLMRNQRQTVSPKEILNNKWALNYFFEKWLTFLLTLSNVEHSRQHAINA